MKRIGEARARQQILYKCTLKTYVRVSKHVHTCAHCTMDVYTVAYEPLHDYEIKSKSVYRENTRRKIHIKKKKNTRVPEGRQ